MSKYYESIICISDLQAPFEHPEAYKFLTAIKEAYYISPKKTKVINQGDEGDFHFLAPKFLPDPDGWGGKDEYWQMREHLEPLWDLFPEQDVCESNHTLRPFRKAYNAGIPSVYMKALSDIMGAPKGVRWQQRWIYNEILFEHGEGASGKSAALAIAMSNRRSTSIGHQHCWGGVTYSSSFEQTIFGMNTGCLIDITAYAFKYARTSKDKPTLGTGVILDNIPVFIPMLLNDKGRWIGKLPI